MIDDAPKTKQVIVYYEKSDDYKLLPASGAFGGPTPTGDIIVEFFAERPTAPQKVILEVDPTGAKEVKRVGGKVIREIQVGIMLRADQAHSIGKWLIEKAAQVGYSEIKQ